MKKVTGFLLLFTALLFYMKKNTNIDFGGGERKERVINNENWSFYKNSAFQWGTTYETYNHLYNFLGY